MPVEYFEEGPALSAEDLDALEENIDCKFPQSYRAHLLKHNGGIPYPSWFRIQWGGQEWAEGWESDAVSYFLSVNPGCVTDFMSYYTSFLGRIPDDTLVIAYARGGNLVLLGIGTGNAGKLYFWSHSHEADDRSEVDFSNVGFVADSIDQMIEGFFDGDEE